MIDRYMDRPNSQFSGGKYGAVAFIYFADFIAKYYLIPKPNLTDNQPEILVEISSKIQLQRQITFQLSYHLCLQQKN